MVTLTGIAISLGLSLTGGIVLAHLRGAHQFVKNLKAEVQSTRDDISTIKNNHLPHIQSAMEAIPAALDKQTDRIVLALSEVKNELAEQRTDIRMVVLKSVEKS